MAKGNGDGEETRGPTRRVVVKRERVIVVPEGVTFAQLAEAKDERALRKLIAAEMGEAWMVVGEFEGHSKAKAIEAYAGKPGTPDAKLGAYRAPSATAWQGGMVYDAPPLPLVQRRELED